MQRLEFERPNSAGQLLQELNALPALAPSVEPDGSKTARFWLQTRGERIVVQAEDGVDLSGVAAVVNAHSPAPVADRQAQRRADSALIRNLAARMPEWAAVARLLGIDES